MTDESSAWSAYDEGYLRAHQWASSLAAGAALPQEAPPFALGAGEVPLPEGLLARAAAQGRVST